VYLSDHGFGLFGLTVFNYFVDHYGFDSPVFKVGTYR